MADEFVKGGGLVRLRSLMMNRLSIPAVLLVLLAAAFVPRRVEGEQKSAKPQLVWLDTDIGDDIDDAFALGLIVKSPELKLLGVSTAFGDTQARAYIVDRYFAELGVEGPLVTAGVPTKTDNKMSQRAYGDKAARRPDPNGVTAMLDAIRAHPGEVTLIAIGPLFNVGAAIEKDPMTFRKVKRVVIMGGSVYRGYGPQGAKPAPEWNILCDPKGAQQLFASGVPLYVMPLDSTQVPLDAAGRDALFTQTGKLGVQLKELYTLWAQASKTPAPNPTLYDPVAVTYTLRPDLCPAKPMHLDIDDKGMTIPGPGKANAEVCLKSDEAGFLLLLTTRLESGAK